MSKTFVAAAVAALTLLAAPAAHAKGVAANLEGCRRSPRSRHPFAPWWRRWVLRPAPRRRHESGLPGWTLPAAPRSWTATTASACAPGKKVLCVAGRRDRGTSPICID